jgi:integrase
LQDDYAAQGNRSWESAQYRLRFLRKVFGRVPAVEIGFDQLNRYAKTRLLAKAARSTVRYELSLLRRGFVLAHQAGKVPAVPPFPTVSVGDNARKGFASPEEVDRVVSFLPRNLKPLVRVLAWTGWRLREISELEWREVDFAARTLKPAAARSKNKKARTFPFRDFPALAEALREQRERTTALEREQGKLVPTVFWRGNGERNLLRAGVQEDVVMKLCGWTTRSMLTRYNVTAPADLAEGVGRLGAFLEQSAAESGTNAAQNRVRG